MSDTAGSAAGAHRAPLLIGLALNGGFALVEATAAWVTGSLVLLADAGHMLTDVAGLTFALLAIWFARRPATAQKTFGYYRLEILAALLNGLMLLGLAGFIFIEAAGRYSDPPKVASWPVLIFAVLGLVANLVPAVLLRRGAAQSLTVKSAFLDMLGDAVASGAAIAAGVIMLTTGWRYADPLLAMLVGVLLIPRTYRLLAEVVNVLLEGAPSGTDMAALSRLMVSVPGVRSVHDVHVWTVTSGFVALSGHVEVAPDCDRDAVLITMRERLDGGFDIRHVTLQVETASLEERLAEPCLPETVPCYATNGAPVSR